ncbi:GGDEF domain-containing protein [Actinotalea ferrariae]|uniref:GGDEF domain-containing protein n=1 Tax=Actinotalea ferrariae TaxID=1386098 RepID=UPI001C8BF7F4|nr:GGDEF domain-containing protein [Actinotalea ferrariae]MBX9244672.1 GGDEF domain-containing protein [Actinotalea ferrariae]
MSRLRPAHVHVGFTVVTAVLCVYHVLATHLAADRTPAIAAVVLSSALPGLLLLVMLLRRRIVAPMPWWFVLGAMVALTVHNAEALRQVGLEGRPVAGGALFLLTLPLGYVGLLVAALLVSYRYARADVGGIVDGVLIGIGAASLLWAVALTPALTEQGAPAGTWLYTFVVVLLVSGIAGAVVRAVTTSHAARAPLAYLLVAVGTTLAGNVLDVLTTDPETGAGAWWVSLLWIAGYVALAAAAAHPSHVHLSRPETQVSGRLSPLRLAFLGGILLLDPLIVAIQTLADQPGSPLLVISSLLVVPLVMLRVGQLARLHAAAETRLERLATHDVLTDLPNRRAIDEHLEAALGRVARGVSPGVVVLFLDLDDFKAVNDDHGHHLGDRLLVTVGRRLRAAVRAQDLVGRFGGDEFVVVIEGDPDVVRQEAEARIASALQAPVRLGEVVASARASVGAAEVRPGDDVSAEQVLSAADARMYERKRPVRGPVQGFEVQTRVQSSDRQGSDRQSTDRQGTDRQGTDRG